MISEVIAAEGFKLAMTELISHIKKKSSFFTKIKLDMNNSYLSASKVEDVKTIWQVDKVINLNSFYYPSKVFLDDNKRQTISSLRDLPENGKIVIQGTAGQGKSIFLRYLTGQELKNGNLIPIFIELRKLTEKNSIQELIISALSNLGIESTTENLDYIFESRKTSLILDAFDEIKNDLVRETLNFLESLCEKHHNLQIIVSSRPGSDVQLITHFRILNLCPLIASDFPPMLKKLMTETEDTKPEDLVKAIHKSRSGMSGLITTPLLLTLVVITYKSFHRIPEELHEFYSNLFYLLVNRHDSTKPGFTRKYESKLNEIELEKLFCAFCFICSVKRKDSLSRAEAIKITKRSKEIILNTSADELGFLQDSKKNTCLIVEEGLEYHFIHKSIKEYHAAKFLSESQVPLKEKFYAKSVSDPAAYRQELQFLSSIDNYYHDKLFLIPIQKQLLQELDGLNDSEILTHCLKGVLITTNGDTLSSARLNPPFYSNNSYYDFASILVKSTSNCSLTNNIFNRTQTSANREANKDEHEILNTYGDDQKNSFLALLKPRIEEIKEEHKTTVERVKKLDNAVDELDF